MLLTSFTTTVVLQAVVYTTFIAPRPHGDVADGPTTMPGPPAGASVTAECQPSRPAHPQDAPALMLLDSPRRPASSTRVCRTPFAISARHSFSRPVSASSHAEHKAANRSRPAPRTISNMRSIEFSKHTQQGDNHDTVAGPD